MKSSKASEDRLKKLRSLPDEKIDYTDIPELDEAFWEHARLAMPNRKDGIYIKLDADVLDFFKKQGRGYQARINAVLKAYKQSAKQRAA